MKILVVSQYFWPENFRINDLVAEWCARGHEVTVLTGVPNYPQGEVLPEYRADPAAFSQFSDADVVRVPMRPRGTGSVALALNYASFALSAAVLGPIKLRNRRFDRIFVFEPSPITVGIPAAVMKWVKRCPLVFWVLDIWPESLHAVGVVRSERVLNLIGKLVGWIYRRCDTILAQSHSFVTKIRQRSGPNARIEYFPSWAEALFDGAPCSPAPELAAHSRAFKILFAGNVGEAQDFPAILDAAERLKDRRDIQWLIVGDGRMTPWVSAEIKRRGLEHTTTLMGRFPLERMPDFFAGADALLVSLKKSDVFAMTIPGKVQSYLAAGKPLLGMLDGEGADVISSAGAGLVCAAGDGAGLASNARQLVDMGSTARLALGESGRRHYQTHFERNMLMDRSEQLLVEAGAPK